MLVTFPIIQNKHTRKPSNYLSTACRAIPFPVGTKLVHKTTLDPLSLLPLARHHS